MIDEHDNRTLDRIRIHIIPANDWRDHTLSRACWCEPTPAIVHPDIIMHNSADHREDEEHQTGHPVEPGRGWWTLTEMGVDITPEVLKVLKK